MSAFRSWAEAARPRTLPLAVTCVLLGGALAKSSGLDAGQDARFVAVMMGAGLTVVLLQILANFANDLGDFQKGTDTAAGRTDRALASGALTESAMKRAVKGTATLAFLCGVSTLVAAFWSAPASAMMAFGLGALGVFSIVAAMRYTMGRKSYGYKGLGDVYVMLFFGPVGVLGVGLLLTHAVDTAWLWIALFSGCMSVAVLNLNNLRDHASDALGRQTHRRGPAGVSSGQTVPPGRPRWGGRHWLCSSQPPRPKGHGEAPCGTHFWRCCTPVTPSTCGVAQTRPRWTPN